MRKLFLCLLLLSPTLLFSQANVIGKVLDFDSNKPLPFVTINTTYDEQALTTANGEFVIKTETLPLYLTFTYQGYKDKSITISSTDLEKLIIRLTPQSEHKNNRETQDASEILARTIVEKAIKLRAVNNPKKALQNFRYKSYNKFKITADNEVSFYHPDTSKTHINSIFNTSHSFFTEKVSFHQYEKIKGEHEKVLATRMSGFKEPVYDVLGIKVQSNSLYERQYTILNNQYAGPLSKRALKNYSFKVLDTLQNQTPAYVILFRPKRAQKVAGLEGILYLDVKTLAIQKAIAELKGELNVMVQHNFEYIKEQKLWFPKSQKITIKPGSNKRKVSLFGGSFSVGKLAKTPEGNNDFLISETDLFDIEVNHKDKLPFGLPTIQIDPEALNKKESYWEQYRTKSITQKDQRSFPVVDSIVQVNKIERKISRIQGFKFGYFPVVFFDFDLTYPIKYNNYEGIRTGLGGVTNEKLSKRFRIESYLVYGFKDRRFKYGIGGGALLNRKKGAWLNVNYQDDLREVGSFLYLTDKRVYSLFEPRLVNIDFYYKHKTWSSSLQYRISPKLLSETQISVSNIDQTGGYEYTNEGTRFSSYKMAESSISLRWSPFSEFLRTPDGYKEIKDGYPKISAQYTQGYKGFFESNFSYTKLGIKAIYAFERLNKTKTSVLLEADVASGNIPLTHLFHAYPNAPTKETILQRFSVAGRRSFETMFFSEFFSDRLATLQIAHQLRPFKITKNIQPVMVLITKYALGDVSNPENHNGIRFNSLKHGYQESGFELNKIFAGFGLSFAYRYGAYHLPNFEDNLSFKFTFYMKI